MEKKKQKKGVLSVRWSDKNLDYFRRLDFIDGRTGGIRAKAYSFNSFINNLVTRALEIDKLNPLSQVASAQELQRAILRFNMIRKGEEIKELEKKIQEIRDTMQQDISEMQKVREQQILKEAQIIMEVRT